MLGFGGGGRGVERKTEAWREAEKEMGGGRTGESWRSEEMVGNDEDVSFE